MQKAICRRGNKRVPLCQSKACKTHGDYKVQSLGKTLCKKERPGSILNGVNGKAWQTLKGKETQVSDGDADEIWRDQQGYSATGVLCKLVSRDFPAVFGCCCEQRSLIFFPIQVFYLRVQGSWISSKWFKSRGKYIYGTTEIL